MHDRVTGGHPGGERARAEQADDHRRQVEAHQHVRQHLLRARRWRREQHASEADQEDRHQKNHEGRVEDHCAAQGAVVARREGLHEKVRPTAEADHGDDPGADEPLPRLGARCREQLGLHLVDALEHWADAAVELVGQPQTEGPREPHHQHALKHVGPAHAHDTALEHVREHDRVAHGAPEPLRHVPLGQALDHQTRAFDLQREVRDERQRADQRHGAGHRAMSALPGDHLCLRDVAAFATRARGAGTEEVKRYEADEPVTDHVKDCGARGVGEAGRREEREGREDRRPDDEVHQQRAHGPVAGHVADSAVAGVLPAAHADPQASDQVQERDTRHDPRIGTHAQDELALSAHARNPRTGASNARTAARRRTRRSTSPRPRRARTAARAQMAWHSSPTTCNRALRRTASRARSGARTEREAASSGDGTSAGALRAKPDAPALAPHVALRSCRGDDAGAGWSCDRPWCAGACGSRSSWRAWSCCDEC